MLRPEVFTEQNFSKIIEFAPIGIVIIDRNLEWKLVNQRFCDIVGYSREELVTKTFLDITHPDDIERNVNLYDRMLKGEYSEYHYEKRYIRKDGKIIWVNLTVSGVLISGRYSHMIALIQDIDENKKYQQSLEEKNRELDTLFYKVSHDLKSPITTLQGICHLFQVEDPAIRLRETFQHLERSVQHLRIQYQSLTQLTQVYGHAAKKAVFSLEKLFDSIWQALPDRPQAVLERTNLGQLLETDSFLLGVVLQNLVANALLYRHPDRPLHLICRCTTGLNGWVIDLQDNGIGISADHLPHIFQMFFKASDRSRGSGLGLYTARVAAEKMNGSIEVISNTSGSTFSILVPN